MIKNLIIYYRKDSYMVLFLSVEGNDIAIRNKKGKEKNRVHLEDIEAVDLEMPTIYLRVAGARIPGGFVKGIFTSSIGKVWCDYANAGNTITIRMKEDPKYKGYIYGVDDPESAHKMANDALARRGGFTTERYVQKTDEEKLRDMLEDSKYE